MTPLLRALRVLSMSSMIFYTYKLCQSGFYDFEEEDELGQALGFLAKGSLYALELSVLLPIMLADLKYLAGHRDPEDDGDGFRILERAYGGGGAAPGQ